MEYVAVEDCKRKHYSDARYCPFINFNGEQCGRSYTAGVREDADIGLPLLRLNATDQDTGDNGRVHFVLCGQSTTNSSATELVAIAADTGWLSTAAVLDYETTQQVPMFVKSLFTTQRCCCRRCYS